MSPNRAAPLLIALHGAYGTPQAMEGLSHFKELADQRGFVVAFLAACDLNHPWNSPQDLNYISSFITQATGNPQVAGRIDRARVYVSGFSAGGAETWFDGCKLSRQVAAIAVVSDAMNGQLYDSCRLTKPVSELLIVGSNDGSRWTGLPGRLPNPYQTTLLWRQLNGCGSAAPQVTHVSVVTQETWSGCTDGSAVALYVVQGAGHVWPPYGARAPKDYPASVEIWNFLSAFRAAPASLTVADARVESVRMQFTNRRRSVRVTLTLREPVAMTMTLGRGRFRRSLGGGRYAVAARSSQQGFQIGIPNSIPTGKYTLILRITDAYGRTMTVRRAIRA